MARGTYTITARADADNAYCDCSDTAAHAGGWCWSPDGAPRTDLERSVVFDYPTTTHVEIVFD